MTDELATRVAAIEVGLRETARTVGVTWAPADPVPVDAPADPAPVDAVPAEVPADLAPEDPSQVDASPVEIPFDDNGEGGE